MKIWQFCIVYSYSKVLQSKLDQFLSTIDVIWEKIATLAEFSCILMPKYVINALLSYFIQYKKLAWGGRNYVERNSSFMFK